MGLGAEADPAGLPGVATLATLAVAAVVAAAIAVLGTYCVRGYARTRGVIELPRPDRAGCRPTPKLGGLAVVAAAVSAAVGTWVWAHPGSAGSARAGLSSSAGASESWGPSAAALLIGAVAVAAVGLYDDLRDSPAWLRLSVEGLAAAFLVGTAVRDGAVVIPWPTAIAATALIVLATNSFNLLDNTDGALATVALVIAVGAAAAALPAAGTTSTSTVPAAAVVAATVGGACAGFLVFNRPPASIYLGDCGSLAIGYSLTGSLLLIAGAPATGDPAAPVLLVAGLLLVPAVDTTLVLVTRRREGRPLMMGGRDHLHHRLRRVGLGPAMSLSVPSCLAAIGVVTALTGCFGAVPAQTAGLALLGSFFAALGWALQLPSGTVAPHPDSVAA